VLDKLTAGVAAGSDAVCRPEFQTHARDFGCNSPNPDPGPHGSAGRRGVPITERRGCQPLATRQPQKSVAVQRGSAAALVAVQH